MVRLLTMPSHHLRFSTQGLLVLTSLKDINQGLSNSIFRYWSDIWSSTSLPAIWLAISTLAYFKSIRASLNDLLNDEEGVLPRCLAK